MDYSKLVGIAYEKMNCWELVVKFYSDILEMDLSHYYSGPMPERQAVKNLIYTNRGDFLEVHDPQFGDLVILKIMGIECHIGVCLGEGKLLHTTRTTGSIVDRLSRWKHLIVGFYRAVND